MTEKQKTRRHHFIPKMYLKNFTNGGQVDSLINVYDLTKKEIYESIPKAVAFECNLYRLEGEDLDSDEVEKSFSKIESLVAPIIQNVIQDGKLPSGQKMNSLIYFIALLEARNPFTKAKLDRVLTGLYKRHGVLPANMDTFWKQCVESLILYGTAILKDTSNLKPPPVLPRVKRSQNWYLHDIFYMTGILFRALRIRKWILVRARPGAGHFVCSDTPISLILLKKPHPLYGGGFLNPDAHVSVPLSKDFAMLGVLEHNLAFDEGLLTRRGVALQNASCIKCANRIFAAAKSWDWWDYWVKNVRTEKKIFEFADKFLELRKLNEIGEGEEPGREIN